MAGLTKEQRLQRDAEKEATLRAELESKIRAEYEAKLKAKIEATQEKKPSYKEAASKIQKLIRIPLDTVIPVVCNTVGGATYISKKTMGLRVDWDDIGSVEYMEFGELASMRNTDRRFFEDNWIVLCDTDEYTSAQICDSLKISQYYKDVPAPDNIDEIFELPKEEIVRRVAPLSKGMRQTIAARAAQKYKDKTLDMNIVDVLESALGIQFTF